jgi:hypothetical protein
VEQRFCAALKGTLAASAAEVPLGAEARRKTAALFRPEGLLHPGPPPTIFLHRSFYIARFSDVVASSRLRRNCSGLEIGGWQLNPEHTKATDFLSLLADR